MPLPDRRSLSRIAVLGAGTIGASWTAFFLSRGFAVRVHDPAPDGEARVRAFVETAWPTLERLGGLARSADKGAWSFTADPAEAVRDAEFVQESAPETLPVKRALYDRVAEALPEEAVFASSTSGIMPSELQRGYPFAARLVVGHPFNPPHIIPLVEVVGGRDTDPAVVDWALAFYNGIGKKAIRIAKEVPGHLVNRLQAAIWREAVHAVVDGIASVEDVDTGITYGPGLRWAIFGPHLTLHLAGGRGGMAHLIDHIGPAFHDWWADLGRPELTPEVRAKIVDGVAEEAAGRSIAELERERDALLLDLMATLAAGRQRLAKG